MKYLTAPVVVSAAAVAVTAFEATLALFAYKWVAAASFCLIVAMIGYNLYLSEGDLEFTLPWEVMPSRLCPSKLESGISTIWTVVAVTAFDLSAVAMLIGVLSMVNGEVYEGVKSLWLGASTLVVLAAMCFRIPAE